MRLLLCFLCIVRVYSIINTLEEVGTDEDFKFKSPSERAPFIKHRGHKNNNEDMFLDKSFLDYSKRPATCEPILNNYTCMGAKLPYKTTTLNLTDLNSQEKVSRYKNKVVNVQEAGTLTKTVRTDRNFLVN